MLIFRDNFLVSIVILVISILAFMWSPPPEIDSYRYYEYAKTISSNQNIFLFLLYNITQTFDFIYYTFFFIASMFNIPFQFVTGISIYILLYQTYLILQELILKNDLKISKINFFIIFLMICTSMSFVNLFGISRFVCALMFFAIGFKFFLRDKRYKSFIYFACAIFTHVGLIAYLILFLFSNKLSKNLIRIPSFFIKVLIILFIPVSLFSYLWIELILNLLSKLWILESNYDYVRYFEIVDKGNFVSFNLGFTDILLFIGIYTLLTLFILNLRIYTQIHFLVLIIYFCLGISLGFSQMWVQRTLIFLIPFIGIILISYLGQNDNKIGKSLFHLLSLIWFILFLANLYSYRTMLNFNLP